MINKLFKKIKKLKKLSKKKHLGVFLAIIFGLGFYFLILKDLPSPTRLQSSENPQSSRIYDRSGKLLYTVYADKNRTQIPLNQIPKDVQNATIAIEDKSFYTHGAVDFKGIARAFISTTIHQEIQGGSTLTQQLVKNTLLSPEQTIKRKIKEVILSYVTEILYSKEQILEMYLNQIPYGGTAYGIQAAAQTYFGKEAKDLTLAESALLAGLPEAPSVYSPFGSHPELAIERQRLVLQEMYNQKYITKSQRDKALAQKLIYKNISQTIKAPHFVLYIKDLLTKKYGEKMVEEGGLSVTTSLDLDAQEMAQASVAAEVANLSGYHVTNGAALITNPATGEILAMVGSKNYFDTKIDGNVNVTLAHRQPGSSIKPINYAVGLMKGYSAATPFVDKQICFPNQGGINYCPVNYDGKFHGLVLMREALGNSLNIPAVKMLKLNGVESMIQTAKDMGITTFTDPERYGLSLTLGGAEVTMIDMATAFGVFANSGYRVDLHPILEVKNSEGKVLEKTKLPSSPKSGAKAIPEAVAYIISDILKDNNARLLEFGSNSELNFGNSPVSAKTGTTNDFKDNWTIGYTPNSLVAVWVGNNDNTPMSGVVSGVTGAAPIFHDIMRRLLLTRPAVALEKPSNVVSRIVCKDTGAFAKAGDACPTKTELFIQGVVEKIYNVIKKNVWVVKDTGEEPPAGKTDNLELKEESVIQDATGDEYCITCAHPSLTPTPTPTP